MPQSKTPIILITGATGNIGRELTKKLSAHKVSFRAMVRSSKAAKSVAALKGTEIGIGDFQDATGVPPHSFDHFARDYTPSFS